MKKTVKNGDKFIFNDIKWETERLSRFTNKWICVSSDEHFPVGNFTTEEILELSNKNRKQKS